MDKSEVIDATELISDVQTLLVIAISAMSDELDVIDIGPELSCSPKFMVKVANDLLSTMYGEELSDDAKEVLHTVKAQMAIAEAMGR